MVGLEREAVGVAERVGQLLAGLVDVLAQGDAGELEASTTRGYLSLATPYSFFLLLLQPCCVFLGIELTGRATEDLRSPCGTWS